MSSVRRAAWSIRGMRAVGGRGGDWGGGHRGASLAKIDQGRGLRVAARPWVDRGGLGNLTPESVNRRKAEQVSGDGVRLRAVKARGGVKGEVVVGGCGCACIRMLGYAFGSSDATVCGCVVGCGVR
jgi:hypothetical protein